MIIRTYQSTDINNVVELLKSSLGESLIKKTESIWRYKHLENPFGESYVILAIEDSEIVGIRAFMQWRWQFGLQIWTAYRAVDTATHPHYQGKGIFKKLTLNALDEVAKKGECFVFNTPNNQSRPGYLKMGWKIVDSLQLTIVTVPLYIFHYILSRKVSFENKVTPQRLDAICELHNSILSQKNCIFTPKSASYLKWRFENNPMQEYLIVSNENFYIALYIKKHRFFKELRVVEIICSNPKFDYGSIRNTIIAYAFKNNCWLITVADKNVFGFGLFGKFGPKLTFKPLTQENLFINKALFISNWKYSLGDLELF